MRDLEFQQYSDINFLQEREGKEEKVFASLKQSQGGLVFLIYLKGPMKVFIQDLWSPASP